MAQVTVRINGRDYLLACEDGEEEHLAYLAEYINTQVEGLVESVGQVGEARLLLMAALMLADELADAGREVEGLRQQAEADASDGETALSNLVDRIESVADGMESA
ncbi:MAG: cell division protein ZapA [Alphaproteobacteria bacterium]|jgi:cell division protein ZapA|nr:cell division protein ZapA [Alphaproteobacteria bacterium]MDP6815982.1 cell division protein ZapA [Alphaproteobacteria bacterium]